MNYEETLATLKAIQASYSPTPFLMDPDAEPRFVINSNERTIEIPEEFKFLAVKMDHMSERIYFEIPRYFDGEDLSTKICVVQYINANGKEAVEGIASIVDVDYTSEADKIIFRWNVDNNTTKYAGDVSFSVRFYTISDDNRFTYSWNTVPAILPVLDTIDNTGQTVTENYPTELLQWQYRMTELDRTISEKIEEATTSIDADTKAAQDARKGAEDAESRVNAIVAGNEAYTKQQSHDLFALALKGTAEAAKSITIYPDKGSNVIATINGFTKQSGSGDPSPTNVRALTNGGIVLNKTVFDGSENWLPGGVGIGETLYFFLNNAYSGDLVASALYSERYPGVYIFTTNSVQGIGGYKTTCYLRDSKYATVDDFKAALQANPLTVWYATTDGTGALYAPIILQGVEYRATCLPLTAPLCEGDSVVSWARSGCDKVITFDGSEDEKWETYQNSFVIWGVFVNSVPMSPSDKSENIYTNILYQQLLDSGGQHAVGTFYAVNTPASGNFLVVNLNGDTDISAFRAALAAHPLTVWYRSTNYTESADIPVSLETHQQSYFELAIADMNGREDYPGWVLNELASIIGKGVNEAVAGSKCNIIPDGRVYANTIIDSNIFFIKKDIGNLTQSQFKLQYPDLVAQVTLPYKTPITYAHPAVFLPALPDDTGKVTITGEANGTVSAKYNKNVTKAFEDILTRISALELHALGG